MKIYYLLFCVLIFTFVWMYGCYRLSLHYELNKKELIIQNDVYEKMIINKIRHMNGRDFEVFCSFVLKLNGFKVELTPATRDGGKDLILNGNTYVECKCYREDIQITSPQINKLLGASASDGINSCIFITTSSYSKDCHEMLDRVNKNMDLQLWNIYDLTSLCENLDKEYVLKWLGYSVSSLKTA